MFRAERWSLTLNPPSPVYQATLLPTTSVLPKRLPLAIATGSRIEEDLPLWARLSPTEWSLSCLSGMTIPPTCFGSMLHTHQPRMHQSQVSPEAHAPLTPESQLMSRRTLQVLPLPTPTSSGVLLAAPSRLLAPSCASRRFLFVKMLHASHRRLLDLAKYSLL